MGDITSNLISYYKLDESSGLTTADSGSGGNTGNLINMTGNEWTEGVVKNALAFDGINDRVDCGNAGFCDGWVQTIAFWLKAPLPVGALDCALGRSDEISSQTRGGFQFFLIQTSGITQVNLYDQYGSKNGLNSSVTVCDGTWHHVVFTSESGFVNTYKIYIDSVRDLSASTFGGNLTPPGAGYAANLRLGCRYENAFINFLNGTLDEVRIYDRTLTQDDIDDLYAWRGDVVAKQSGGNAVAVSVGIDL